MYVYWSYPQVALRSGADDAAVSVNSSQCDGVSGVLTLHLSSL